MSENKEQQKDTGGKHAQLIIRTQVALVLFGLLFSILYLGHWAIFTTFVIIQIQMVRELFQITTDKELEKQIPNFRYLLWYFFIVTMFAIYTSWLKPIANIQIVEEDTLAILILKLIWKHNLFGASVFYIFGLIKFIVDLTPDSDLLVYQYQQFTYCHMILIFLLYPSSLYIMNIEYGLIWFSLPIAAIIANDSFAYFAGRSFGRHPLISISPKKTWEGFFGGFLGSIVICIVVTPILASFNSQVCPKTYLNVFPQPILEPPVCDTLPLLYQSKQYSVNALVELVIPKVVYRVILERVLKGTVLDFARSIGHVKVYISPMMIHAMVIALFASMVAPFGGYFASGLKRALKIKDFGTELPGHGGFVDRFDCVTLMGLLSNMYLYSVINQNKQYQVFQTASYVVARDNNVCDQSTLESMFELILQQKMVGGVNITAALSNIPKETLRQVSDQLRQCFE